MAHVVIIIFVYWLIGYGLLVYWLIIKKGLKRWKMSCRHCNYYDAKLFYIRL